MIGFGLLLMAPFSLHSQEKKSLSQIISILEETHAVKFNYPDDLVTGIYIFPPSKDLTLPESLQYLESSTGLLFTKMDADFVLVNQGEGFMLCGYIKDRDGGKPLESATIQGKKHNTISDVNGFFQLRAETETESVSIRFLGYRTISKTYKEFEVGCPTIYMHPDFQSLSEILISSFITTGINKLNDGSFEIDFARFDILPGLIDNDVLHSVQAFPGIQSINETVSNINIRGGSHDQNLILWDGIKMYQSGHFFGLISMYNPQITQKVSLRKNGSSAEHTDGVSGTIAMQTEDSLNTKFNGNVGANLIDVNAFADFPIGEKSSLQIAGRKSISDFVKTPVYTMFFERISQDTEVENNTNSITNTDKTFDFYDTSLRWLYKISERDELRVNFITASNELQFTENATIDNEGQSRESSLKQNSIAGGIYYNRVWNDRFQTTLEVYETDYKLKAVNVNVLESQRFLQENVVSETSLKLKMEHKLNERFHLLNGYHFVETEITNLDDVDNPLFRFLVSEVVREHSGFSQLGYKSWDKKTSLNAGIRLNYIDKFKKWIWEPRLSFNHRFLENFTFEVLGEMKHQTTSQIINFQNDFLGIEKRRWQLSNNRDIPIIESKQVSLGIHYNHKDWLVSAEGYFKKVDGITTQSQGFQNQFEFEKTSGSYEVKGVDVLLRKKINSLNFWASYSFMNNDYTFSKLRESSFPSNFHITHAVMIGASYTAKKLKIAAGLNWHTGKPTTLPVAGNEIVNNEINSSEINSARLPHYMRLDISALYDFKFRGMVKCDVGASVWNVLNRENEIDNFYRLNNGAIKKTGQRSLGITPNAVLRVYF